MKIGDRVRLLRGTEEGRIVNIKKDKIVEIEIEDGFIIPALKNEVVVINKQESETFKTEIPTYKGQDQAKSSESFPDGIYLGFKESVENSYVSYFVNQTSYTVLFTISQRDKKTIYGKSYGVCENYSVAEAGNFTSSIFNESKRILVQIIFYENETKLKKPPVSTELILKKEQLIEQIFLQSIMEKVALIKIDEGSQIAINPAELRESMLGDNQWIKPTGKDPNMHTAEQTVDLHIDALTSGVNPSEILEIQLNEFEKAYDNALVMNLEKLKIIHGVGAGILRKEIHKRLSKKTDVKYFEDADKERFGFGSTIIYF